VAEQQFYLTTDQNPNGKGLLAVITLGHPQRGDENVVVCSVEVVKNHKAAKQWYRRMLVERPWEERH